MAAFNYKQEYERYKKYYLSLEPILNKPTNRAYTAVIFSFLAVSLFSWYAIRPTMQTIFTLKREIADRTIVDKQMEDKISALIEAQANFENIQDKVSALSDALPLNPEPIRALAQLRGLATDSGVTISSFNVPSVDLLAAPKTTPAVSKVTNIPIAISVTGPYPNIKNFLISLVSIRRIMQVTSLNFTPRRTLQESATPSATPATTGTNVQVDLKLNVFYLTQ